MRARKAAGVKLGRPKGPGRSKLDSSKKEIYSLLNNGATKVYVARKLQTSLPNLYNWIKKTNNKFIVCNKNIYKKYISIMNKLKVDLHIHTPASKDYKGEKSDSEYFNILNKSIENKLSTIAITDHNTICGYIKFKELEETNLKTLSFLKSIGNSSQDVLNDLEKNKSKFEKIKIIPGVELSVYPKLHIIVLFNEKIDIEKISLFLKETLKLNEYYNDGNPDGFVNLTPDQLIERCFENFNEDFLIICPHVDSSNGLWNELNGQSRIRLVNNKFINCFQILNLETINRIDQALKNDGYEKGKKITYIQASDFHGADGSVPGAQYSIFETDRNIDFYQLKNLLKNNKPTLSSTEVNKIYDDLVSEHDVIEIILNNSISFNGEDEIDKATEKLCAFLNTEKTLFVVKINNSNEDYAKSSDILVELLKDKICSNLDPIHIAGFSVIDLSYSINKKRFVFKIEKRIHIYLYKESVFIVKSGMIDKAKSFDISSIVLKFSYNRFYKRKEKFLKEKAKEILTVSKSLISDSILSKIQGRIIKSKFGNISDINNSHFASKDLQREDRKNNGIVNGDYYYIEDGDINCGRIENYSYSRITCPQHNKNSDIAIYNESAITESNCLVIVSDGRVYYINDTKLLYSEIPFIEFRINDEHKEKEKKLLVGLSVYLKSNFILWFFLMFYEEFDLIYFLMKNKGAIPFIENEDFINNIYLIGEKIINEEEIFLKKYCKEKNKESAAQLIKKHNSRINYNFQELDKLIVESLSLSKDDYLGIINTLNDLGYYTYDVLSGIDKIYPKKNK